MTAERVPLESAYWFQEGPGVRKWQFTESGVKLLNVGNILKDGTIDLSKTDRHLSIKEVEEKYSHFLADAGDLVIASSGITIDDDGFLRTRGAFIEEPHLPLCMNTSTIRFKPVNGNSDLGFLRHWLQSVEFRSQISREVTGIAQKNFGPSHLKRLEISLPPLDEQKRIAKILDAADALRSKRRESIAQLDALLQSTFLEMFGDPVMNPKEWASRPLADAVLDGTIVTYGIVQAGPEYAGGVPYVRTGDIVDGRINAEALRHTNPAIASKFARSTVRSGEIVMSIRATVGTSALVPAELDGANLTQGTARIAPGADTTVEYLLSFIRSAGCQNWIQRQIKGATFREITLKRLREMPVLLPPKRAQQTYSRIAQAIEAHRVNFQRQFAELDTFFLALQSRAFNGEL